MPPGSSSSLQVTVERGSSLLIDDEHMVTRDTYSRSNEQKRPKADVCLPPPEEAAHRQHREQGEHGEAVEGHRQLEGDEALVRVRVRVGVGVGVGLGLGLELGFRGLGLVLGFIGLGLGLTVRAARCTSTARLHLKGQFTGF